MNLDPTPPDTLDLSTVLIWPSSSRTAADQQEQNLKLIAERKAVLHLMLDFIGTHRRALAGTYWRVCYLDPEIEISCRSPHDKGGGLETAAEIALRWPQARWKRVSPKWESERTKGFRNWETIVNGVTLRIEHAEKFEPIPLPPDGDIEVASVPGAQVAVA